MPAARKQQQVAARGRTASLANGSLGAESAASEALREMSRARRIRTEANAEHEQGADQRIVQGPGGKVRRCQEPMQQLYRKRASPPAQLAHCEDPDATAPGVQSGAWVTAPAVTWIELPGNWRTKEMQVAAELSRRPWMQVGVRVPVCSSQWRSVNRPRAKAGCASA